MSAFQSLLRFLRIAHHRYRRLMRVQYRSQRGAHRREVLDHI